MTEAEDCAKIFQEIIPSRLRNQQQLINQGAGIYEFHITGADSGIWTLDLRVQPPEVIKGTTGKADVQIEMSSEDFLDFYHGKLSGFSAFLENRIRVKGDMALAMKVGRMLKSL